MRTTQRNDTLSLIERLFSEPHRFAFPQAVRILVRWLEQRGISEKVAFEQILRFRNSTSLAFPASEIEALTVNGGPANGGNLARKLNYKEPVEIAITPAFFGLLGTTGSLPLHYTEQTVAFERKVNDESVRAFVDVLSHRMVAHFYRACCKYRFDHPESSAAGARFKSILQALGGQRAGDEFDRLGAFHAAQLRTRPISAATISDILSGYFDVPIAVEEFVGAWDPIPPRRRSTLGVTMPKLGVSAALGTRMWRHDLRVRLNIGPLDEAAMHKFLPNGKAAVALQSLLGTLAVPSLQYEARLILSPPVVEPLALRTADRNGMKRLGWNAFLTTRPGQARKPEIRYMLHPTTFSTTRTTT